jgi:hypothetical protein
MQVPYYALAPVPPKVPTSTQLPGRENSRTAETNKIFPRAPTYLRWRALRPTCRAHSEDAAFADPSKTNPILAVAAVISQMDDIRKNSTSVTLRDQCFIGAPRGDRWEVRGREGSHGGPLQPLEEPPSPIIWSNASVWSFADSCAVSRHQCNAGSQQHLLCPHLYWRAVAPVWENTQSCALAPADISGLNHSFIHPNTTTRDCPRTLITYLRPAGSRAANFECTTATLCHQGHSTTTRMGRRNTGSANTMYMMANKRTKPRGKIRAIHTDAHVVM